MTIALAIACTVIVIMIALNFSSSEKKIQHEIEPAYETDSPGFVWVMGQLLGPPVREGNRITHLRNGDRIFPAMLEAIRAAKSTICFETFIYWSGRIAREFADALSERARAGVRVHVLLDWVGSNDIDEETIDQMVEAGVEVERYHPVRWYLLDRLNNRTHRKLLVVDGRIGFTGGVGIADEWLGDAEDADHWRDSHFRAEGPVVAQMQSSFMDNWMKTKALVLYGPEYFPLLDRLDGVPAQMFRSSPRQGSESVRLMYLLGIAAAKSEILIGSAYFVPDDLSVLVLRKAAERGVRIRIIVPGRHIDTKLTRRASRSRWGPLLEAGVEIHEFTPTMYHTKMMIVDRFLVSVGSTNFDNRSFRLNDEANLNVFDRQFAEEMAEVFEEDRKRSHAITLEEWLRRPWKEKLIERLAGLLRSQL